jgi:hypothetical protein
MSKDITTLELNNAIVEVAAEEVVTLDVLSLALVGGGECQVNL